MIHGVAIQFEAAPRLSGGEYIPLNLWWFACLPFLLISLFGETYFGYVACLLQ